MTSNRRFSQVVTIEYTIEVEGDADGFHTNPIVSVPITIGNLPLRFEDESRVSNFIQSIPPEYSSRESNNFKIYVKFKTENYWF